VHAIRLSRRFRLGLERALRSTEFRVSLTQRLVPHCQAFLEISQLGESFPVENYPSPARNLAGTARLSLPGPGILREMT